MGGWERIEVRGGRGAAAEERLSDYCRIRPIFLMLAVVPGAPHIELALAGAVLSALMGGLAWLERSEYREEADVLRATAAAIVGASSSERPRGRTTAG